jgi:hypothetical protein
MHMSETAPDNNAAGAPAKVDTKPVRALIPVQDESEASALLDSARFDHLWRVAQMFSKSSMVPDHYKENPQNCMIAIATAIRLGVDPFMFLQKIYVVSGKPGLEGQLVIALLNTRGRIKGGIKFKFIGEKGTDSYGCIAWGVDADTGETLEGPEITLAMAAAEGWTKNAKWKNLPQLMLMYRSGAWFARTHRPEVLLGFSVIDELEDVAAASARDVTLSAEKEELPSQIAQRLESESAGASASGGERPTEGCSTNLEREDRGRPQPTEDPDAPLNDAKVKAIETAIKSVSMTELQRKQFLGNYGAETVEQIKNAQFQDCLRALMGWKPKGK